MADDFGAAGGQEYGASPTEPSGLFIPYVYAAPAYTILVFPQPLGTIRIPLPFRTILTHTLVTIAIIFVVHRLVRRT